MIVERYTAEHMVIHGRDIAEEIYGEIKGMLEAKSVSPVLTVFTCEPNFETKKYLALKERAASQLGIELSVIQLPDTIATDKVVVDIEAARAHTDAIVVQLPFPEQIDIHTVLKSIPQDMDADALSYNGSVTGILPPVVGAIYEIAKRTDFTFESKRVVVVGEGRLVGRPAALYAKARGADVTVVTKETVNLTDVLRGAEVIISGAGQPHLITPDMVAEGVVLFDAGTSESAGVLVGDIHPDCAGKASIFTPVPGGIGPITIAVLLKNVVFLALRRPTCLEV